MRPVPFVPTSCFFPENRFARKASAFSVPEAENPQEKTCGHGIRMNLSPGIFCERRKIRPDDLSSSLSSSSPSSAGSAIITVEEEMRRLC